MKVLIMLLLVFMLTACVPCTKETQICKDGTIIHRDNTNWCEFEQCPKQQECGVKATCPDGWTCYAFETGNYCYFGDPCLAECGRYECEVLETYPARIRCIQ